MLFAFIIESTSQGHHICGGHPCEWEKWTGYFNSCWLELFKKKPLQSSFAVAVTSWCTILTDLSCSICVSACCLSFFFGSSLRNSWSHRFQGWYMHLCRFGNVNCLFDTQIDCVLTFSLKYHTALSTNPLVAVWYGADIICSIPLSYLLKVDQLLENSFQ